MLVVKLDCRHLCHCVMLKNAGDALGVLEYETRLEV